ncbi:hypothetical protein FBZ98_104452 [Rhizobium sp. ERR 922]|nr:hypothetical protein FBZ98_104452 [Rhizobium sp. ERR 922]TWB95511.1 hypothetical protein FBZ97_104199 [Rhizobium sp. ERR 942]
MMNSSAARCSNMTADAGQYQQQQEHHRRWEFSIVPDADNGRNCSEHDASAQCHSDVSDTGCYQQHRRQELKRGRNPAPPEWKSELYKARADFLVATHVDDGASEKRPCGEPDQNGIEHGCACENLNWKIHRYSLLCRSVPAKTFIAPSHILALLVCQPTFSLISLLAEKSRE